MFVLSPSGTLTRCLESLETLDRDNPEEAKTTDALKQVGLYLGVVCESGGPVEGRGRSFGRTLDSW